MFKNVIQEHLKSFWDQFVFIVANEKYTRERKSKLKASALTHLSRIWLITAACLMYPTKMKKNVHRITGLWVFLKFTSELCLYNAKKKL